MAQFLELRAGENGKLKTKLKMPAMAEHSWKILSNAFDSCPQTPRTNAAVFSLPFDLRPAKMKRGKFSRTQAATGRIPRKYLEHRVESNGGGRRGGGTRR